MIFNPFAFALMVIFAPAPPPKKVEVVPVIVTQPRRKEGSRETDA